MIKFILEVMIDDEPDWVKITKRRRDFLVEEEIRENAMKEQEIMQEGIGSSQKQLFMSRLQNMPSVEWHVDN